MRKSRKYTDQEFIEAVRDSISIRETLKRLNLKPAGGNYKVAHNKISVLGLDISHFKGQSWSKGLKNIWHKSRPLEDILIENSYYQSHKLRIRLLKDNYFKHECGRCKLTEWNGQPISLELDHINGINTDNRLENLAILCPNCHAQTDTYRGKGKGNRKKNN